MPTPPGWVSCSYSTTQKGTLAMFNTDVSSTDARSVLTVDICFLRLPAVMRITGLGKTSVYRKSADGSFPAPVKLGDRAVGWIKAEVLAWANARVAERSL